MVRRNPAAAADVGEDAEVGGGGADGAETAGGGVDGIAAAAVVGLIVRRPNNATT